MNKRDLKADLEQIQNFRSKWRQSTSLEEAWDIGVAWEYFYEEKAELWLDQALAEKERADKAEALARELAEVLLLYEKWEADLLMDNSLWQSTSGLPFITQEVWDELVAVQVERNKVLKKAKVAGCQHIFEDITSLSEATQGVERSMCAQCGREVLKYVSTKEVLGDE